MNIPEQFKQYIWLIETIRRRRSITLEQIQEEWERSYLYQGQPLTRSSFNRHRDVIEEALGIRILCNRRNNYKYSLEDDTLPTRDSVQDFLVSSLSVSAAVSQNKQLRDRILLEKVPSAGNHLEQILEAMKKGRCIRVIHQSYGAQPHERIMEPYCVKLFDKRWYVLGHFTDSGTRKGYYRHYSLDRILSLEIMEKTFRMDPEFSCKDYFREYFGVLTKDEMPVERILIRAFGSMRYYLRDLPLHQTQVSRGGGADYEDYELTMKATEDFCNQLLQYGCKVKVLAPVSLRDKIRDLHLKSYQFYDQED